MKNHELIDPAQLLDQLTLVLQAAARTDTGVDFVDAHGIEMCAQENVFKTAESLPSINSALDIVADALLNNDEQYANLCGLDIDQLRTAVIELRRYVHLMELTGSTPN